ncbi:DUF134 domain-containing protein [Candidatus Babeliales bacterium]|nr:DUF134 domain-containing protein [Candidatus Babeliales bacterium]
MVRPIKPRFLRGNPKIYYFKPQGIPLKNLEEIILMPDEFEVIKLHDDDDLDQIRAAKEMLISQPTFARILNRAHKKIAKALIQGKAIRIEKK